jgi:hypothetical protein
LDRHGGQNYAAETAAGLSRGYLSRIRSGDKRLTAQIAERIRASLEGREVEKVDLRQKHDLADYPPELAELIKKFGGITAAEDAIQAGHGLFAKIKRGDFGFSKKMRERARAALNGETIVVEKQKEKTIPANCPPLLKELYNKVGSFKATYKALGTSDGTLYAVMSGGKEMPLAWITRAKAALGHSVIGLNAREQMAEHQAEDQPAQSPMPEMIPWDKKTLVPVQLAARGGSKGRVVKVPPPVSDLLKKFDTNVTQAARSMGRTAGYLTALFEDPKAKFSDKMQRTIHAALHGAIPPSRFSMGEEYDKYLMGLAICFLKTDAFDRVHDIADILNGRLAFRKNTNSGWLLIYQMATEDLPKFKKLAMRDAQEIVCP